MLSKGCGDMIERAIVCVVPLPFSGDQGMEGMMKIIIPLGIKAISTF